MGFGRRFLIIAAASVGIFILLAALCSAEKAPYSFVKESTLAPPTAYYDYIVVGGGTAGCALAATLATATAQVLVLERGGQPYDNPNVTSRKGFPLLFMDSSPNSPMQRFVSTDGVFNIRPRILGGGSAVNAGFYSRAPDEEVRRAGWDPKLVQESYEWVERKVVFRPRVHDWQAAVRDGLLEAEVLPDRGFTYEHLEGTKISGTIFDGNDYRHTAADLLEYADPTKITIFLHSTVQKILFKTSMGQTPKAYGVSYMDFAGGKHVAYLNDGPTNEIILSAGAIGSPQLLMLSGIGPAQQLEAHEINVVLNQPMVGQDMSDNPRNGLVIPTSRPVEYSLAETVGITNAGSYIEALSGLSDSAWLQNSEYAQLANQTILLTKNLTNQTLPQGPYIQAGSIVEKVGRPFSSGHMELQSDDPNETPRITFNYFQDIRDLQVCIKGMKVIKKVVESKSISSFVSPNASFQSFINLSLASANNLRTKHPKAAHSLKQFCMDTVITIWHYHGGCQVDKIVDRNYKVIGVDALRVVDGSTFSFSPGTNPQATLMMLGRYVGQNIMQERLNS